MSDSTMFVVLGIAWKLGFSLVVYQHHPRDFRLKKDPALLAQFLRRKKKQIGSAIQVHPDEVRDETGIVLPSFGYQESWKPNISP